MGLDLTALEGLNIPEFTIDPTMEEEIVSTNKEKEDSNMSYSIEESDSIESFGKEEIIKEVVSEEENSTEEKPIEENTPEIVNEEENQIQEGEVSVIKGVAEWAKSEQIFDYTEEEFEDSPEFLKLKLEERGERIAEERYEKKLSEDPEVLLELRKNYKDGVPLDELIYTESRIIEYTNYKEDQIKEDINLQKKLIIDNLINNNYSEDRAKVKADKFEDTGMLEEEALDAHEQLITFEKKYKENLIQENKRVQEVQKKEYEAKVKEIETQIDSLEEIIPGIQITKEERQRLKDGYLKPDKNRKTELMKLIEKDPLAQLKIAQLYLQLGGNLDKVKIKAKTEATKEVKKAVTTYKETPGLGKINLKTIAKAVEIARKQREQR